MTVAFPPIEDFEKWLDETSTGFPPLTTFRQRNTELSDQERGLLEAYQFGVYGGIFRDYRNFGLWNDSISKIDAIIHRFRDASGFVVYRGLVLERGLFFASANLLTKMPHDPAPSSWSFHSRTALNIAFAQLHNSADIVVLLRSRVNTTSHSLYLDDFEHEVLRPGGLELRIDATRYFDRDVLGYAVPVMVADATEIENGG